MANLTPLPKGLSSMGCPVTAGAYVTTGSVYFVDSNTGLDVYDGHDPDHAFATLDHAVTHCSSGLMDTIFLMPNHAETISTSTECRLSVDGIMVIGLGSGETRPTFTIGTATALGSDIAITGHSIVLENILGKPGADALTGPILIGSCDITLNNIEWREDDQGPYETVDVVVGGSSADGVTIDGFKYAHNVSPGGTQVNSVLNVQGDRITIRNCWLNAGATAGIIECASTAHEHMFIHDNYIHNASSNYGVVITSSGSGAFLRNFVAVTSCEAGVFISPSTHPLMVFESYGCGSVSHSAIVCGNDLATT